MRALRAPRLILALALALGGVGGCASVDFDRPKSVTTAFEDTDDTHLGRRALPRVQRHPGRSGFILQNDGIDSLASRLLLAQRAERSIDAQYFLITADETGYLFVEALLAAADRGVRVRLLIDDIQTAGYDTGMAALDSHPNFEVRVFNPFARGGSRALRALADFSRVNRRMHNKTFTVDNQFTIIGGRNIAAEYFAARRDVNFGDLDALGIGPIVRDVSRQFDLYWNDELSVPVPAFASMPEDPERELHELRQRIAAARARVESGPYADVLNRSVFEVIELDDDDYIWARAQLVYDAPEKAAGQELEGDESILTSLRAEIAAAESELIVVSPYFVPTRRGVEAFGELTARGVQAVVLTNSLASNNHGFVHSGYAPRRKALLERGVQIYEVRDDAPITGTDETGAVKAESNLHSKIFIVDRKVLFLGSFNFDPRSAYINTELGVVIDSPELAGQLADVIDRNRDRRAYRVVLNEDGKLRWITHEDGERIVLTREPDTTFWERLSVNLLKILPLEGQL